MARRHSPRTRQCGTVTLFFRRTAKHARQVIVSRVASPVTGKVGIRLAASYCWTGGRGRGASGGSQFAIFAFTHERSSVSRPLTLTLVFTLVAPCWYTQKPFETELEGPKTVAGSARGRKAFLGAGSRTTMTRVPKPILG